MNVLLLNSFSFFAAYPPASTSYLCAFLRGKGINVTQIDVNLEVWDYILSPEYLSGRTYNPENGERSNCPLCPPANKTKFEDLKKYVTRNIRKALNVLKDKYDFYDFSKFNWAMSVIYQAQLLIYYDYGTFLTNHMIFWPEIGFDVQSLPKIYELSENININPFIKVMEHVIIPKIFEKQFDLTLVDIIFPWDIIPALTLNKLIKKHFPQIHINYPGQGFDEFSFSRLIDRFKVKQELLFGFDSIFVCRNDEGIAKLIRNLKNKNCSLYDISNLAYIDKKGNIQVNDRLVNGHYKGNLEHDYSDLPLDRYFTPDLVFIEKLSDRCFWAKCTFCSINSHKGERIEINLDRILSKIKNYQEKYGCRHFWFLDEACTPEFAVKFGQNLETNKINIIWSIRTRVDKKFTKGVLKKLYGYGLRELWIGLETVNPEILRLMNKTDTPEEYAEIASKILKHCNEIGIGVHFCTILGFPSETDEQRNFMIDFLERNKESLSKMPLFATFNTFSLMYNSPMYNKPERFGITDIDNNNDRFNMISIPYKTKWNDETSNPDNRIKLDSYFNKMLNIFVRDQTLILTWFNVCDSPYELLFKKYYSENRKGNPFQKEPSLIDKLFIKVYLKLSELPYISIAWKEFVQKYFIGIK